MSKLLLPEKSKVLLLGNEAIARGALEAGVGFASAYPGTPSSEIIEELMKVSSKLGIYVEWSVNEKVAFEAAYAAAICGVRSLVAMKHVGLNVASDPLMTSAYLGTKAGFVIVSADDPNMYSSQNEQDNRWYGLHACIPVFEPSSVQEAKDLTKIIFDFSERFEHPVILRSVTRLSHVSGIVVYGKLKKTSNRGTFIRNPSRWVAIPEYSREHKKLLVRKWDRIIGELSNFSLNKSWNENSEIAVIASGIGFSYAIEALEILKAKEKVTLVKLASSVPIPRKWILSKVSNSRKILVVEEGDGVVEFQLKNILQDEGIKAKVYGKTLLPRYGELQLNIVIGALAKILNKEAQMIHENLALQVPQRNPTLCPGCPYRPLYYALKIAVKKSKVKVVYSGDIGCYTLGVYEPFNVHDIVLDMGSSVGLANGFAHVLGEEKVVAIIGDSTFYHAGIPALINAVCNRAPMLTIILDNEITAMTGLQPHPGSDKPMSSKQLYPRKIPLENIVKGIGVKHVYIIDPYDVEKTIRTIEESFKIISKEKEPVVIIARRPCTLYKPLNVQTRPNVLEDKCNGCGICYNMFSCPAIVKLSSGKARIREDLCVGCNVCVNICPLNAITIPLKGA